MNKYIHELTFWDGPIAYFIGRYRWRVLAQLKKLMMSFPKTTSQLQNFKILNTEVRNDKPEE